MVEECNPITVLDVKEPSSIDIMVYLSGPAVQRETLH